MYSIEHLQEKTLAEVVAEYLEIKTELGIFTPSDLPKDVQKAIEILSDKLEYYYGKDNLHTEF